MEREENAISRDMKAFNWFFFFLVNFLRQQLQHQASKYEKDEGVKEDGLMLETRLRVSREREDL